MANPKRMAECHPDRPHMARGMCGTCYKKWYRETHPEYKERQREACKKWYKKNKKRVREYQLKWHEQNPRKREEYSLRRHYGITLEDYDELLKRQNNCCAICGKSSDECRLYVDHSHDTSIIRGLLCSSCNALLGRIETHSDLLQKAAKYLETANTGLLSNERRAQF